MTEPHSRDAERVPRRRLALAALVAAALLAGIYLYFRYSGRVAPLLGLRP